MEGNGFDSFWHPKSKAESKPKGGPAPGTCGEMSFVGKAVYHDGVGALPKHMVRNNPQTWAHALQSSLTNPNLGGASSNSVDHILKVKWDCTEKNQKTEILEHKP